MPVGDRVHDRCEGTAGCQLPDGHRERFGIGGMTGSFVAGFGEQDLAVQALPLGADLCGVTRQEQIRKGAVFAPDGGLLISLSVPWRGHRADLKMGSGASDADASLVVDLDSQFGARPDQKGRAPLLGARGSESVGGRGGPALEQRQHGGLAGFVAEPHGSAGGIPGNAGEGHGRAIKELVRHPERVEVETPEAVQKTSSAAWWCPLSQPSC